MGPQKSPAERRKARKEYHAQLCTQPAKAHGGPASSAPLGLTLGQTTPLLGAQAPLLGAPVTITSAALLTGNLASLLEKGIMLIYYAIVKEGFILVNNAHTSAPT